MISFPVASACEFPFVNSKKFTLSGSCQSVSVLSGPFEELASWNHSSEKIVQANTSNVPESNYDGSETLKDGYWNDLQSSNKNLTEKSQNYEEETLCSSGCSPSIARESSDCFIEDNSVDLQQDDHDDELSEPNQSRIQKFKSNPIKGGSFKTTWDVSDNDLLLKMALEYRNNWKRISKLLLETRNIKLYPKILRKIYEDLLSTKKTERAKFTHEDDLMIVKYMNKYGLDWNRIATHFDGKNGVMIKNRFYSYIKKRELVDSLAAELDELEAQSDDEEVSVVESNYEGNLKLLLGQEEDLPIFNKTFHELVMIHPEDELHEKIFESNYQPGQAFMFTAF